MRPQGKVGLIQLKEGPGSQGSQAGPHNTSSLSLVLERGQHRTQSPWTVSLGGAEGSTEETSSSKQPTTSPSALPLDMSSRFLGIHFLRCKETVT